MWALANNACQYDFATLFHVNVRWAGYHCFRFCGKMHKCYYEIIERIGGEMATATSTIFYAPKMSSSPSRIYSTVLKQQKNEETTGFCLYPRLFRRLAIFIWNIRLFSLLGSIVYICITQTIRIQMLPFCCCSHTHLHEGRSNGKNRKWCSCATLWNMLNACLTKNGSLDSSKTKIYAYNAKTMKAKN